MKISLTKLIQASANVPLHQAKARTDALLDGNQVRFDFANHVEAMRFAQEATALGVEVRTELGQRAEVA